MSENVACEPINNSNYGDIIEMAQNVSQLTRRSLLSAAAVGLASSVTGAKAEDVCLIFDSARQQATTPDQALEILQEGNRRFAAGKSVQCDLMAQARATSEAQAPIAAIVGCVDSRVPPEFIFDQKIGDIFVARIAGNFINPDIIGSLEFATKVAGAKAIVVLGHTGCGAVKGAIDSVELGNLTQMLQKMEPAIAAANITGTDRTSKNDSAVQKVVETNAQLAAAQLLKQSEVLRELADADALKIAAAVHDLDTGVVRFF